MMNEKKYERYYDLAGKASFENWESVKASEMCGCYFCKSIFPSTEVGDNDWITDSHGRTVLCPECGIDAVLGDASGIPIQEDVLEELYDVKFGCDDDESVARCVVSGTDTCDKVKSLLDCFGIETYPKAGPGYSPEDLKITEAQAPAFVDAVTAEYIPDFYFFDSPAPGQRYIAQELRVMGSTIYFKPSGISTKADLDCVALSDIVEFSSDDVPDTSFAERFNDKLFVQTLGKGGFRYKLRDGEWRALTGTPEDDFVDTDDTGDWTTAAIIYGLTKTRKPVGELTDEDLVRILKYARSCAYFDDEEPNK